MRVKIKWDFLVVPFFTMGIFCILMLDPGPMSLWCYPVGALVITLVMLGSIILHEWAHYLVGRKYGLRHEGIYLRGWGGQCKVHEEDCKRPGELFWLTFVGPVVNILLGGLFFIGYRALGFWFNPLIIHPHLFTLSTWHLLVGFILYWSLVMNLLAGIINLMPILPLDGGHVAKSIYWKLFSKEKAVRVAPVMGFVLGSFICMGLFGLGFGYGLFGLGILGLGLGYLVYEKRRGRKMRITGEGKKGTLN